MKKCVQHASDARWGVHSARRTFYLLAVLGGGSLEDVMRDARHQDESTAKRYYNDSKALKKMIERSDTLKSKNTVCNEGLHHPQW